MKGFDCFATVRDGWPEQLATLGYSFFARYYRRAPYEGGRGNAMWRSEAARLFRHGFWALGLYQNSSNTPAYFTAANAKADAQAAIQAATFHSQPPDTAIYFAVDCDVPQAAIQDVIAYFLEVKERLWRAGYHCGVYGSGAVCQTLYTEGVVRYTWLANARGWRGYKAWEAHATVRQGLPHTLPFGLEIDGNETTLSPQAAGFWRPDMGTHRPTTPQATKPSGGLLSGLLSAILSLFGRSGK
jgi:hypothetical protein